MGRKQLLVTTFSGLSQNLSAIPIIWLHRLFRHSDEAPTAVYDGHGRVFAVGVIGLAIRLSVS